MLRYLSPEDVQKFDQHRGKEYGVKNRCLKCCPTTKCTKCSVLKGNQEANKECDHEFLDCGVWCEVQPGMIYEAHCTGVDGACGNSFCTGCSTASHRPAPCGTAAKWRLRSSGDAMTNQLILETTKVCPQCKVRVEKNGGCLHMTCKRGCGHEFCWLCKGPWKRTEDHPGHGNGTGGYYKCSLYEEMKKAGDTHTAYYAEEKRAADAKKYTELVELHQKHLDAVKHAKATKTKMMERIAKISSKYSAKDGQIEGEGLVGLDQHLTAALDTIIDCHQVLAWTYPITFYMPQDFGERALFERLQTDLDERLKQLNDMFAQDGCSVDDTTPAGTVVFVQKVKLNEDYEFVGNEWIKATLVKAPSNADDKKVTVCYEEEKSNATEELELNDFCRVEVGAAKCFDCCGKGKFQVRDGFESEFKPAYKDQNCDTCKGTGELEIPVSEALLCPRMRKAMNVKTDIVKTFRDTVLKHVEAILSRGAEEKNTAVLGHALAGALDVFHLSEEDLKKKQQAAEKLRQENLKELEETNPEEAERQRQEHQAAQQQRLEQHLEEERQRLLGNTSVAQQEAMLAQFSNQD